MNLSIDQVLINFFIEYHGKFIVDIEFSHLHKMEERIAKSGEKIENVEQLVNAFKNQEELRIDRKSKNFTRSKKKKEKKIKQIHHYI